MEVMLRIPDDYCQGWSLSPETWFEEDEDKLKIYRSVSIDISQFKGKDA
jgi:hypothetical protein